MAVTPRSLDDERYRERRRRNNEAVRRCRENKRARLSVRDEVAGQLQSDNVVLRSKIEGLNTEVRALRNLLLSTAQKKPPIQNLAPQSFQVEVATEVKDDLSPIKPLPLYALPKKGIPRVPTNSHLPPLKRRITLPPSYNPLASGAGVVVPFDNGTAATSN